MFLKITISSEYSLWISILCLLFGFGISALLYRKHKSIKEVKRGMRYLLFTLRAAYMSILAFLLISPFVLSLDPIVEKPIIIFGQDNSESIKHLSDSVLLNAYLQDKEALLVELNEAFNVHTYDFGEAVVDGPPTNTFQDRLTDVSEFLTDMEDRYENRNVAMLILASDGLYNKGQNPLYKNALLPFELSSIALGDTTQRKDIWIENVKHNRLAFLGNTFEINVQVGAALLNGRSSRLSVLRDGRVYKSQPIKFNKANDIQNVELELPADQVGQLRFEIQVDVLDEEASNYNNQRYFYIDVLEGQQEILILSASPHPDVAALKLAIGKSKNFHVTSALVKDFDGPLDKYNLLILNQYPFGKRSDLQKAIAQSELPVLYLIGNSTSIEAFNELNTGLTLNRFKGKYNETTAIINPSFQFFSFDDNAIKNLNAFPPLNSPFADYSYDGNMTLMFNQKIGKIETSYPLISFLEKDGKKTGFILGEGIWRWPLFDYRMNASTTFFNDLVQKMVQYLSLREDKSRFRVESEPSYFENNAIRINAEFYDKTYELENNYEAVFQLIDEEGNSFDYTFLKQNQSYQVDLGRLNSATYKWKASLFDGVERFEKSGSFVVKALQLEKSSLRADHDFLYNLSLKNGGNLYYPNDLRRLSEQLLADERFKPVLHYNERMKEIISFKWLFVFLLLFFGTEWFLRKWLGLN